MIAGDTGIVESTIEPAERIDGSLHHGLDVIGLGHLDGDGDGLAACLVDGVDRRFGPFGIEIGDGDASAFAREEKRRCTADAASGAGDECGFAFQKPCHDCVLR